MRQADLSILSRPAEDEEVAAALAYLASGPREERCRDLVWAMLNRAEFRFNQ